MWTLIVEFWAYLCAIGVFNALEINNSFYRIPEEHVVKNWLQRTPRQDFVYTVKAHRVQSSYPQIDDGLLECLLSSASVVLDH